MRKVRCSCICGGAVLVLLVALLAGQQAGASALARQQAEGRILVVTSPASEGPGTLRQALLDAQRGDTIIFDPAVFPPDQPTTIAVLNSGLPELGQGQVIIDASNAGVILDGSQLPREGEEASLIIASDGNRILGLQILYFAGSGIWVGGQANQIGGPGPGEGNVLSGNWDGINVSGSGASNNVIQGNYIGTDASGTAALGNQVDGVWVGNGAQGNMIGGASPAERNVLSGNGSNGVVIDNGQYNTVRGNYIGTDASGTRGLGNNNAGVVLAHGAQHNLIGGDAPGDGNLISGNALEGVFLAQAETRYNTVSGNIIGADVSGTAALPNGWSGINLAEGTQDNRIGGTAPGEGNLIGGNQGEGVTLAGAGVMNNLVTGNLIGVDLSGDAPLSNERHGVGIGSDAGPNTIGPGNVIAYNSLCGIRVGGAGTVGNTITANAIYDNGDAGIEVAEGANDGITPPEVRSVGTRAVKGAAPPGATIEVFYDEGDQGRVLVGSTTADAGGAFAYVLPVGAFAGPHVLLTATDTEGNTSTFSPPRSPPVPVAIRELPNILAPAQVSTDPEVVGTNLGLALFCAVYFGLTSTVFNSTLEDYRDEIVGGLARLVPRAWAEPLGAADRSLGRMIEGGRGRLLLTWLVVLLLTALIESFLDPGVGILSGERLSLLLTLFASAVVVSGLELAARLFAHWRWAPGPRRELHVQWIGLVVAVACVVLSRALRFVPGYLYGIVGAVYLIPRLEGTVASGKRSLLVLLAILTGSFLLWIATLFLPPALGGLEPVLVTVFLIGLEGAFFQSFPLAVMEGGDIWSWRKGLWFALFLVVFFCAYHFVLNPDGSDVQALQQNGVQTIAVLMGVFGLATALLWLLLPFRLGRKRRRAGKPGA